MPLLRQKPPCGSMPQGGSGSALVLRLLVVLLLIVLLILLVLLALLLLLLVVLCLLVPVISDILVHADTSVNKLHHMHEYYSAKRQRIYTYFCSLKRAAP